MRNKKKKVLVWHKIMFLNLYVPRSRLKIHKANIDKIKAEINKFIVMVGDFKHIYLSN